MHRSQCKVERKAHHPLMPAKVWASAHGVSLPRAQDIRTTLPQVRGQTRQSDHEMLAAEATRAAVFSRPAAS